MTAISVNDAIAAENAEKLAKFEETAPAIGLSLDRGLDGTFADQATIDAWFWHGFGWSGGGHYYAVRDHERLNAKITELSRGT